ncbi:MAG TPA: hypothetical protein VIF62_04435 [Labilithrix sp.]|jgi:hypothetical protein
MSPPELDPPLDPSVPDDAPPPGEVPSVLPSNVRDELDPQAMSDATMKEEKTM